QTPGASRTVLEAIVPYSRASLVDWIGGTPDQACSASTARAMAMAAFLRARQLASDENQQHLIGVGATASLASDRPKRGERRIHAALQTATSTQWYGLRLASVRPAREEDERAATVFLLWVVASACGERADGLRAALPSGEHEELLRADSQAAPPEQSELLLGLRRRAVVRPSATADYFGQADAPPLKLVFPGAFNPPHAGHLRMAAIAEARLGEPLEWELSLANVDKPPLDFITIRDRIQALRAADGQRPIALTRAPTFAEKADLFPAATFVVGADTMLRIGEPRYYGGDAAARDEAIDRIAGRGCRFLVFGRSIEGRFRTLEDLEMPKSLLRLCDQIPADEFREDVSSTALRRHPS
ncbi:MAG: hypothetical protein DCC67_16600, partial [Planctomycetota bacterium]